MFEKPATITTIQDGGVASAVGFKAGGIHAGFRKNPERKDLALVEADNLCSAAGVFTQNVFCAAPVTICREHLGERCAGTARAVVINSGTANAATGAPGLDAARETATIVADAVGCDALDVLVASTGVIGQQLPLQQFRTGVPALHAQVSVDGGSDAAHAIMTTDTVHKEFAVSYVSQAAGYEGVKITVGGMAKGSGMIMPNMATMIAVLTTDAPFAPDVLHRALLEVVNDTFNKVTVDSDTSTNDTCLLLASGCAAQQRIEYGSDAYTEFVGALYAVGEHLARVMAADGEGATKLVTVTVKGAASPEDADAAARSVANSPLVKTCINGHDANWGRVAMALGKSGAAFEQENTSIDMMGLPVLRNGLPVEFSEEEALRRFEASEILLEADLGAGSSSATVWTCDYSHDYISINGDYRS